MHASPFRYRFHFQRAFQLLWDLYNAYLCHISIFIINIIKYQERKRRFARCKKRKDLWTQLLSFDRGVHSYIY